MTHHIKNEEEKLRQVSRVLHELIL